MPICSQSSEHLPWAFRYPGQRLYTHRVPGLTFLCMIWCNVDWIGSSNRCETPRRLMPNSLSYVDGYCNETLRPVSQIFSCCGLLNIEFYENKKFQFIFRICIKHLNPEYFRSGMENTPFIFYINRANKPTAATLLMYGVIPLWNVPTPLTTVPVTLINVGNIADAIDEVIILPILF